MKTAAQKMDSRAPTVQPAASQAVQAKPKEKLKTQQNLHSPYLTRFADSGISAQKPEPKVSYLPDFSRLPFGVNGPAAIQKKLQVNTPGDAYEQEADRVAEQVLQMPDPRLQRVRAHDGYPSHQNAQATQEQVQAKSAETDVTAEQVAPPAVHEVLQSSGQPLDPSTREFMEPRFGHDFSNVRLHTDATAAESAAAIRARAWTVGSDIAFGAGEYAPSIPEGRQLLAHELAHVVQRKSVLQRQPTGGKQKKSPDAKVAAIPDELTEEQVKAAQKMATAEGLGKEAILALQTALGVTSTEPGQYDEATVAAVYKRQLEWKGKSKDKVDNPGFATPAAFRRLGLISTKTYVAGTVSDKVLDKISKNAATGVTVAIYTKAADVEFKNRATGFAEDRVNSTVGLEAGAIKMGIAMPITSLGEVIEKVQGTHRGLLEAYRKRNPESKDEPQFTKIKVLALFAHGLGAGVALSDTEYGYAAGLHSDKQTKGGDSEANVDAFVNGLSGTLTEDVRVALFACNVGRSPTKEKSAEAPLEGGKSTPWYRQEQGVTGGADSLPAKLAAALGPEASVYAHLTGGHTTENFAARGFGKDAGGLHMFDLMYDEAFIQAQLKILLPDAVDSADVASERARLHDFLRQDMWNRYKDLIANEHKRRGLKDRTTELKSAKKKVEEAKGTLKKAEEAVKATADSKSASATGAEKAVTQANDDVKKAEKKEMEAQDAFDIASTPVLHPGEWFGQIMFADSNAKEKFHQDWIDYWTEANRGAFLKKHQKPKKKESSPSSKKTAAGTK